MTYDPKVNMCHIEFTDPIPYCRGIKNPKRFCNVQCTLLLQVLKGTVRNIFHTMDNPAGVRDVEIIFL